MEIDYSNYENYKYAFYFYDNELETIAESLKNYNKKLIIKRLRLQNSPKNDGQVTFLEKIRELNSEIKNNIEIIELFTNKKNN
jgi:hypothetical protein